MISATSRVRRALLPLLAAGLMAACLDPTSPEGGRCDPDHPCPGSLVCQSHSCVQLTGEVVVGCTSDAECDLGRCLIETGFCVQCVEDADCEFGVCLGDGRFQCGCAIGGDCATGRCVLKAGATIGQCASCYLDAQCGGGVCDLSTGKCVESRRTPAPSGTEG